MNYLKALSRIRAQNIKKSQMKQELQTFVTERCSVIEHKQHGLKQNDPDSRQAHVLRAEIWQLKKCVHDLCEILDEDPQDHLPQ